MATNEPPDPEVEQVVRDMVAIVEDPDADTDERLRALRTIEEALDPQEPVDAEVAEPDVWVRVDEEDCPHWAAPMQAGWSMLNGTAEFLEPRFYPLGTRIEVHRPQEPAHV